MIFACTFAQFKAFLSKIITKPIPENITQLLEIKYWKKSIDEDIYALEHNNAWTICDLFQDEKVIGCNWVYTIMYKPNGDVDRHKAKWVSYL